MLFERGGFRPTGGITNKGKKMRSFWHNRAESNDGYMAEKPVAGYAIGWLGKLPGRLFFF
jgi:hypothetical protein